jgi:hypothetical protein
MNTCAWCDKTISEAKEVFGIGAKLRPGIDSGAQEGTITSFFLAEANKNVPAIVTPTDSEAKKEGYDFIFMFCTQECGKSLKEAIQKEIDFFDQIITVVGNGNKRIKHHERRRLQTNLEQRFN